MNLTDRKARMDYLEAAGMQDVPQDIKDIIVDFLNPQATLRMTAANALKKPIFSDVNLGSTTVRDHIKKLPENPAKWGDARNKAVDDTNTFINRLTKSQNIAQDEAELAKFAGELARLSTVGAKALLSQPSAVRTIVESRMQAHLEAIVGTAPASLLQDNSSRASALGLTVTRYEALKRELAIHVIQTALDAIDSQRARQIADRAEADAAAAASGSAPPQQAHPDIAKACDTLLTAAVRADLRKLARPIG